MGHRVNECLNDIMTDSPTAALATTPSVWPVYGTAGTPTKAGNACQPPTKG